MGEVPASAEPVPTLPGEPEVAVGRLFFWPELLPSGSMPTECTDFLPEGELKLSTTLNLKP